MDECENLPKNMCDSCIIQLNVAYNLKKNAIQSDMKLRQYMIEYGINVTSYTTCSINTVSVIRPPGMILPASTTSKSVTITTAKSTTTVAPQSPSQTHSQPQQQQQHVTQQPQQQREVCVFPVMIKEEPVDYEVMSDITVETNNEAFEEHMRNHRTGTNGNCCAQSTGSSSNQSITPLPLHSMVSVNTKSMLLPSRTSSDTEFINAYMLTPSSYSERSKKTDQSKTSNKPKTTNNIISVAATKSKKASPRQSACKSSIKRGQKSREIDLLKDDGVFKAINGKLSTKRQTRQQLRDNNENKSQPSRSRSGTKQDYKSFFFARTVTFVNGTPKINRRMSVDSSVNRIKRKGRSPNIKTPNKTKNPTTTRRRRNSMSHNRTSL